MGISYYAWEVTEAELAEARIDPRSVISRLDGRADPEWAVIDLDAAWVELQCMLSDPRCKGAFRPRPAYELFAGNVTYSEGRDREHAAHIGLLSSAQVHSAHQDLAKVTAADVLTAASCWGRSFRADYALEYLQRAQQFGADVTSRDHSVIYLIGDRPDSVNRAACSPTPPGPPAGTVG